MNHDLPHQIRLNVLAGMLGRDDAVQRLRDVPPIARDAEFFYRSEEEMVDSWIAQRDRALSKMGVEIPIGDPDEQ